MFPINRDHCCKTEEQLLYNIFWLLGEVVTKLNEVNIAAAPRSARSEDEPVAGPAPQPVAATKTKSKRKE